MSTTRAGRGFIEACPDGAFLLEPETGEIADVNAESARLCGRSREALRGHTLGTLTPEEWSSDDPLEALLDRARDERVTFEWVI
jgi:PAS domain-containing protein